MTSRILKFTISPDSATTIALPLSARVLHVAEQNCLVRFWMEVPQLSETRVVPHAIKRTFLLLPTGADVAQNLHHRGTVLCDGGQLVWHLYEKMMRMGQQPQDINVGAASEPPTL